MCESYSISTFLGTRWHQSVASFYIRITVFLSSPKKTVSSLHSRFLCIKCRLRLACCYFFFKATVQPVHVNCVSVLFDRMCEWARSCANKGLAGGRVDLPQCADGSSFIVLHGWMCEVLVIILMKMLSDILIDDKGFLKFS